MRFSRTQVHQMKNEPAMVTARNVHFVSASAPPPSAPCQESGDRKRLSVAAAKPPIQRIGKRTFMMKVWRDESRRGEDSMALRPNGLGLSCGRLARRAPGR